jgi:nucleoside-diphosphate-sugar epimerase
VVVCDHMRVLLTGATGFIGRRLVRNLSKKRHKIRCLVRDTGKAEDLKRMGVELWTGDVTDKKTLKGITEDIDVVFHLAAVGDINATANRYFEKYRTVNVKGTRNLLEECTIHKIKKFVHFSSVAAMGNLKKEGPIDEGDKCEPKTPYEVSKYESERVCLSFWKSHKVPVIILRPTMVYGKGERKEANKIEKSVRLGLVPIMGNGENLISMVNVDDVVRAAILASKKGKPGEAYIINGEQYTWNDLVGMIAKKMGIRATKLHIPIYMSILPVAFVEKTSNLLGIVPPFTSERLESLSAIRSYDISKARRHLGFKPTVMFSDSS